MEHGLKLLESKFEKQSYCFRELKMHEIFVLFHYCYHKPHFINLTISIASLKEYQSKNS